MADNRWTDRNDERSADRDWYRDDYEARQARTDRTQDRDWDRQSRYGRNDRTDVSRGVRFEGRDLSARNYQGLAGPGSFADYGAPSSNGYPAQFGASNPMPATAWLGSGRRFGGEDRHSTGYGRRDYGGFDADAYRRPGENRSFEGGNPYVQDIADGGDADGQHLGEHRGRGPKNYRRSDARILEDVNDRLTDDAWLDAEDIDVKVKDNEVTLSGTVPNRNAKRHAENLAERVSGVTHVQNNLRVRERGQRDRYEPVIPTTE